MSSRSVISVVKDIHRDTGVDLGGETACEPETLANTFTQMCLGGRSGSSMTIPNGSQHHFVSHHDLKGKGPSETRRNSCADSFMKVRYYADAEVREWHARVLQLLETLHENHGIPVEIDRIDEQHGPIDDFVGKVRSSTPESIYDRDIKQNNNLSENIDRSPSKVYKFNDEFQIAGHVAVVADGVQWASTLQGTALGHGPAAEDKTPIDFLADVAASPSNRICIECAHLLNGDETFCPACGTELR